MVRTHKRDPGWPLLLAGLFITALGCNKNSTGPTEITLNAKYSAIRTYPNGGGIFVISAIPSAGFRTPLSWNIEADQALNASLTPPVWNDSYWVAEVAIRPAGSVPLGSHPIKVVVSQGEATQELIFTAEVVEWQVESISEEASEKKELFLAWLEAEHPEMGSLNTQGYAYMTYPQVLIVEHWTFLSTEWEMRLCSHVMIPPDDWSMVWLRHRGEWDPRLAAKRESNGRIHPIPINEYPLLFGY